MNTILFQLTDQTKRAEEVLETCIEGLAAYAHEAWSGWMIFQEKKGGQAFWDSLPIALTERWIRQANTDYAGLPEQEKKTDRVEARRMVAIILGPVAAALQAEYRRGVEAMRDETVFESGHAEYTTLVKMITDVATSLLAKEET